MRRVESWFGFIAVILVLVLAIFVRDATPTILAYVDLVESEALCEGTGEAVFSSWRAPNSPSYERKAVCPHTEPAFFLGVEIQTELWLVTAYAEGDKYTPGWNTADGWTQGLKRQVRPGITAACPTNLPFGTIVCIEGLGCRVCEDRGGAIEGKRLDVAVESVYEAEAWGSRWVRVAIIWEEAGDQS